MSQNWKDPQGAQDWSANPLRQNPTRSEQLDILLSVLADFHQDGTAIVDLGFGSGIVEAEIFQRVPGARVVGVDFSPAMMALARERLKSYEDRFTAIEHDLSQLDTLTLPPNTYRFFIAIQALHHLMPQAMQRAYAYIHQHLDPGGLFLLLDRMAIDTPQLYEVYQSVWRRLDRLHESLVADHEGDRHETHLQRVREDGDLPVSLEQHLAWLRAAGFETACLHTHGHRALIVGRKISP